MMVRVLPYTSHGGLSQAAEKSLPQQEGQTSSEEEAPWGLQHEIRELKKDCRAFIQTYSHPGAVRWRWPRAKDKFFWKSISSRLYGSCAGTGLSMYWDRFTFPSWLIQHPKIIFGLPSFHVCQSDCLGPNTPCGSAGEHLLREVLLLASTDHASCHHCMCSQKYGMQAVQVLQERTKTWLCICSGQLEGQLPNFPPPVFVPSLAAAEGEAPVVSILKILLEPMSGMNKYSRD